MIYKRSDHINLFMNEVSSFVKKSDLFCSIFKKMILIYPKHHICFVVFKKMVLMTKIKIYFVIFKKMVFDDRNSDLFFVY